ncbi:hypothetical protein SAMN04489740_2861 [Arthrobacter alpinus]|uniref:Uncharacterized protein n=1 Tax=Arthrobacter alpinus TaxID=656366 RepID=A0A1H5MCU5_9MICC|nr:hypothetical protein [Arthrobacter alpinus]SEE86900.1 hypothetical protein SAMN04489740_2861 [Arthrobacter alpinus]
MRNVARFVSFADVHDGANGQNVSVSVLHEAELDTGKSILVLDDRGWASSQPWSEAHPQEIEKTARDVVGPDEPFGEQNAEDATLAYWKYIQAILARNGVKISVELLQKVPHDVALSKRLRERIGNSGTTVE